MSQQQLLARVVQVLDDAGIEYMATGSIVSSLQGQPRATHDIDLLVKLSQEQVNSLPAAFSGPSFYLPETGMRFNVSSPEDTILAKLRWCQMSGGSEKQFKDALRVYEVQCAALDHRYLDEWARR